MSGHIYVISWSTGALKVGRSDRPTQRIEQHRQAARAFGVRLLDTHVVACDDSAHAESLLIKWARARATSIERNEWVFGVDFDQACWYASTLKHVKRAAQPASPDDISSVVAAAIAERMALMKLTERALGQSAGLSPRTVANFLRPESRARSASGKPPSGKLTELARIASALGATVADLVAIRSAA